MHFVLHVFKTWFLSVCKHVYVLSMNVLAREGISWALSKHVLYVQRNAELQRRIELRKLAKLKKKKQEEVPSPFFSVFQKCEKGGRGCHPVCRVGGSGANRDCDEQGFFSFFSLKILRL